MSIDDAVTWGLAFVAGLMSVTAKIFYYLRKSAVPPVDPEALRAWTLKRRWLIISELSSVPAFTTVALTIGKTQQWPIEYIIMMSMALGALGFAFVLHALEQLARNRYSLGDKTDASS